MCADVACSLNLHGDIVGVGFEHWWVVLVLNSCLFSVMFQKVFANRDKHIVKTKDKDVEGEPIEMTVLEYDLQQLRNLFSQLAMQSGMVVAIHLYAEYTFPILLQVMLLPYTLVTHPTFKIHMKNQDPSGDLSRPFNDATGNPFVRELGDWIC
jgi:hypothetical protein